MIGREIGQRSIKKENLTDTKEHIDLQSDLVQKRHYDFIKSPVSIPLIGCFY